MEGVALSAPASARKCKKAGVSYFMMGAGIRARDNPGKSGMVGKPAKDLENALRMRRGCHLLNINSSQLVYKHQLQKFYHHCLNN